MIDKIITIILFVVLSPVLLPIAIFTFERDRKRKIWFFSLLFSPLSDDVRKQKIERLIHGPSKDFEEKLLSILSEMNELDCWLGFRIDWSDIDEVEAQGNAIAKSYGIKETFHANISDEDESVWQLLVRYDIWLQERGYEVVLWDQGSDEYNGFICQSEVLSEFIEIGNKLKLNLVKLDHVNEQ